LRAEPLSFRSELPERSLLAESLDTDSDCRCGGASDSRVSSSRCEWRPSRCRPGSSASSSLHTLLFCAQLLVPVPDLPDKLFELLAVSTVPGVPTPALRTSGVSRSSYTAASNPTAGGCDGDSSDWLTDSERCRIRTSDRPFCTK
jgi:hypothetical protein